MKSYIIETYGSPEGLVARDRDVPKPALGQVVVRLHAAALNARDLMVIGGVFQQGSKPDLIPLSDGAGEVVEVGEGVWRVKPGDRVMLTFHPHWIGGVQTPSPAALGRGAAVDGVLTEYTCVSQDELVQVPGHLSYLEAATLPCAALTAWSALCAHGTLLPGHNVLVQGTGGVSIFALQFAKLFGARVLATTSSPSKVARLKALGADVVIDTTQSPEWAAEVHKATGGEGADLVVDLAGGQGLEQSVASARDLGRVSAVGMFTGAPVLGPTFFFKGVSVHPIRVGSREHFEQMNRAIAASGLQPVIDRVFDFADVRAALHHLQGRGHVGKVVVRLR
jgi:NADPH:quinone reductase-like Zn-dependent oxidoreductase